MLCKIWVIWVLFCYNLLHKISWKVLLLLFLTKNVYEGQNLSFQWFFSKRSTTYDNLSLISINTVYQYFKPLLRLFQTDKGGGGGRQRIDLSKNKVRKSLNPSRKQAWGIVRCRFVEISWSYCFKFESFGRLLFFVHGVEKIQLNLSLLLSLTLMPKKHFVLYY